MRVVRVVQMVQGSFIHYVLSSVFHSVVHLLARVEVSGFTLGLDLFRFLHTPHLFFLLVSFLADDVLLPLTGACQFQEGKKRSESEERRRKVSRHRG